jgi:hypothetical protein
MASTARLFAALRVKIGEFCRNNKRLDMELTQENTYPFPQHCCKFAPKYGQAEILQAGVAEEIFACFPRGSMIPSSR